MFDGPRVFVDRRPTNGLLGGLWEFPGGKLEPGESVVQALQRELCEEFGMRVRVGQALPPVDHAYTHFRVTLHPRLCLFQGLEPRLADRRRWRWVLPLELKQLAMPRANRKVIGELDRFLSR